MGGLKKTFVAREVRKGREVSLNSIDKSSIRKKFE